ncbi:MAG: DUF1492 domain-containing protein [Clostridia bacterium]
MNQLACAKRAEVENGMVVGAQSEWDKRYGGGNRTMSKSKREGWQVQELIAQEEHSLEDDLTEMRELISDRSRICTRIDKAQDMAKSIGGGGVNDMPRVKQTESRMERGVLEKSALAFELEEIDGQLAVCRERLERLIDRLPAGVERAVLKMRYVQYMRVIDIAQDMHFCRIYIYKLLERAEAKLKDLTR